MKCEVEGNGGEDELDVVAVAKPGTKEARAETTQTVAPLCNRLGECGLARSSYTVQPQDIEIGGNHEHG